jgi:hypothetical protein
MGRSNAERQGRWRTKPNAEPETRREAVAQQKPTIGPTTDTPRAEGRPQEATRSREANRAGRA